MADHSPWRWICVACAALAVGCRGDLTAELSGQLNDPDPQVRRAAVRSLSEIEDEQVVAALAGAIEDEDADVRRLAITELGRRGSQAAIHASLVVSALDDSQLSVRLAAAWSLQSIAPDNQAFVPVLTDALLAGEGVAFLDVAEMGPRAAWATPTLIRLLSHSDPKI
ncbi:MAG: HEAT repeat domain-containing protein, partial [Planctomycetota bacterium]